MNDARLSGAQEIYLAAVRVPASRDLHSRQHIIIQGFLSIY